MAKIGTLFLALALVLTACAGDERQPARNDDPFAQPLVDGDAYPVFASSEIVVGRNRFLVGLLNRDDAPIGSPEVEMHIDFFDLSDDDERPDASADMEFVWIDEPLRGLYQGYVRFDSAGRWGAEIAVSGDGIDETMRAGFDVAQHGSTPEIGERVPRSKTPTLDDVDSLKEITTDDDPTRRFYTTSVADAVRREQPFVLIFATPKFCASATCGPMLDNVEAVARNFPDVTFIHVEPYELDKVPEQLVAVPATEEWGLPSEPWVFVADRKGRLVAKYEGVLDQQDLRAKLRKLR